MIPVALRVWNANRPFQFDTFFSSAGIAGPFPHPHPIPGHVKGDYRVFGLERFLKPFVVRVAAEPYLQRNEAVP